MLLHDCLVRVDCFNFGTHLFYRLGLDLRSDQSSDSTMNIVTQYSKHQPS